MPFGGFPPMEVYMAGSLRNCIDRVCQHQYHVAMFFRHFACKAHHPEVAKMLVSSMPCTQGVQCVLLPR